jgi:hypothetical protein
VHDKTFAALGGDYETVGKVDDISIKGLTLSYLCERKKDALINGFSVVDIFLSEDTFHLSKVPCKIVYDVKDPKSLKKNGIVIRRCGLKFGKLDESQSNLLETFIENYKKAPLRNFLSSKE